MMVCLPSLLFAKSPKPKLLVYGSTLEAYVAALQSAASGVPTIWVNPQSYTFERDGALINEYEGDLLDGGVVQQFSKNRKNTHDAVSSTLGGSRMASQSVLTESNPLLISVNAQDVVKIERKKSWKFTLSNKTNYEVQVVIDASEKATLATKANITNFSKPILKKSKAITLAESRSVVFVGESQGEVLVGLLPDLLGQKGNFFVLNPLDAIPNADVTVRSAFAQTISTIANYCAFFKVLPEKIDLRTLQSEIMAYQGRLLPFINISVSDKHYNTIQKMFLSGILLLQDDGVNLLFNKQDSVKLSGVKSVVNQFYSRAQLWFVDNNPEYLTVQDALNLIKFTAFRAEELDVEVKNKWNKELAFEQPYDSSKLISKYEFAVLFEMFASPFAKKISQDGQTIYR